MKRIISRRKVTVAGMLVMEANNVAKELICKLYKVGKATKFWRQAI